MIILIFLILIILIYYFNKKRIIKEKYYLWQYWDGFKPSYIELSMETVDKHCKDSFNIIRLNKDNIYNYLPELKIYYEKINKLIIPHQVDIFRIMLLYKYGGVYMDADMIVLKNPIQLLDKLSTFDFIGFGCTGVKCFIGEGEPSNWFLISKKNTTLMKNILINQLNQISQITTFDYHDLGKNIIWIELNKLSETTNYKYYHYPNKIDGSRDKYGNWIDSSYAFSNKIIEYDNINDMYFFVYYNSDVDSEIKKISREELLSKDWNITKFIKLSLNL